MGETGVASSPDVNSIHWNSAKLAFAQRKMGLGISYTPWLRALVPDINHAYISFYAKPDSLSAIGASIRYFSMGNITTVSPAGAPGQYRPNEFALDLSYARKLNKRFSVAMAARLIRSNLNPGIQAASSFAVDLGAYYCNEDFQIGSKKSTLTSGFSITNMGPKISYSNATSDAFIPANLRIGEGLSIALNKIHQLALQVELNKLLVPSPPVYALDSNGAPQIVNGQYQIISGRSSDVNAAQGMLQSFYDAPGGMNEELQEIVITSGMEYWFRQMFAFRCGYFYESKVKGNRQFFTLGIGVRYSVFGLDFAYLVPANAQRSPLQNTLRFSLLFDFDVLGGAKKGNS